MDLFLPTNSADEPIREAYMDSLEYCPVCSSKLIVFTHSGPTTRKLDNRVWTIYECESCTHGFLNPRPSWDELTNYYSSDYAPYDPDHGSLDAQSNVIAEAKRSGEFRHIRIQSGAKLLDIGCGGGYFLRIMRQLGFQTKGIEPSPSGAEAAKRGGLDVFQGTLEEFIRSSGNEKFDVITLSHVLEHVPDPVETLQLMKRLLYPNGYIWVAVPNGGCVWAKKLGTVWHSTDVPYHLQQFTCESMRKAVSLAGLQIMDFRTHSMNTAVAASFRQYLRLKFLVPERWSKHFPWIESSVAKKIAQSLDENVSGEAILVKLKSE